MQGVYKQMVEAFRALGVEAVPGPGNLFDPEVHEAIMREENDDVPDGTVLKEFRRGFRLGKQLLRAAMVQVSSQICKACSGMLMCSKVLLLSSRGVTGAQSALQRELCSCNSSHAT